MKTLIICTMYIHYLIIKVIGKHPADCDFEKDLCGWKSFNPLDQFNHQCSSSDSLQCIPWYCYSLRRDQVVWVPWIRLAPKDKSVKNISTIEDAIFYTDNYTSLSLPFPVLNDYPFQRASTYQAATDYLVKRGFSQQNTVLVSTTRPFLYLGIPRPIIHKEKFLRSYLVSGELPRTYDIQCLHYSYMLTGSAGLFVSYIPSDAEIGRKNPLAYNSEYSLKIHRDRSYFKKMHISLPVTPKHKILFMTRFRTQMDGNSFAFLDDIYISNSICSATVICNDGGFRCLLSKECINGTMFCDRKRDCSEGSDEHNCNYNSKNSIVFGSSEYPQSPSCGINANKTNSKLKNSSNDHPAMQIKSLDKDKIQNDAKNIKNDARCAIFSSVCTCIISDPSLRFKSLSWKECSSIKAVFYLFFELQNLTCLEVSLPNNQLFSIYYFNIVDSNISTIEIMKKKMTTLQHITIRDSIVENLTITQGNNASEQLQTLQLINCTIKRIVIHLVDNNIRISLVLSSFDGFSLIKNVSSIFSFYDKYFDISSYTLDTFYNFYNHMPFRIAFQCDRKMIHIVTQDYSHVFYSNIIHISALLGLGCGIRFINIFTNYNIFSFLGTTSKSFIQSDYFSMKNHGLKYISKIKLRLAKLKKIDFSSNVIPFIKEGDFNESTSLQILKLQGNLIEYISGNTFKDMISLYLLDLSSNLITKIRKNYFIALKNLNYLYLNYNRINDIDAMAFSNLISLYTLDLSYNDITHFEAGLFLALEYLEYLYIHKNRIKAVDGMFWGLFDLKVLKVDAFSICCAKPRSRNDVHCVAPINEIASCEHLINAPVLNVGIWYIAFLATVGNMIAMICSISTFKTSSFAYFIFSRNLSVADFLMGIYLYIIAITNLVYTGRYGFEDYSWRHSFLCTFAGILATVSSEASALFVLLITIDRVVAIKFPFSRRNKVLVIGSSVLAWIIAISLSLLPVLPFNLSMFEDFYAQSPVCISLPLSVHRQLGWQYSMIIFIGLNFLIFLGIIFGQFLILYEVIKSGSNSQASNIRRREVTLAKSVVAVVVTDLLCWIPIGIIGMLTFSGTDVTLEIYAWIKVLVLPVNSAINPILYTLTAIIRNRGRHRVSESNLQREKELLGQEISRLKIELKTLKENT